MLEPNQGHTKSRSKVRTFRDIEGLGGARFGLRGGFGGGLEGTESRILSSSRWLSWHVWYFKMGVWNTEVPRAKSGRDRS